MKRIAVFLMLIVAILALSPAAVHSLQVSVEGGDGRDLVRIFSSGTVESGEEINDVVMLFSEGTVRGKVKGDCVAIGGKLSLKQGAEIDGDLVTILCSVERDREVKVGRDEVNIGSHDPGLLKSIFMAWDFLLALAFILLFWRRALPLTDRFLLNPASSFLTGFLGLLGFVPLILLLVISIVGILLIPLVPIFYFLGFVIGFAVMGVILGNRIATISGREISQPLRSVLGLLAILVTVKVISLFPLLGGLTAELIKMLIRTFGLGLLLTVLWESARRKKQA